MIIGDKLVMAKIYYSSNFSFIVYWKIQMFISHLFDNAYFAKNDSVVVFTIFFHVTCSIVFSTQSFQNHENALFS